MAIKLVTIITPETSSFLLNPFGERRKDGRTGSECCYTLLNMPGQRYTFSSSYPLEPSQDSSEEFIFFTYPGHEENGGGVICSLSADEQGQFWIESNKTNKTKRIFPPFSCFWGEKTSQIFVNKKKVAGKVRIEEGDSISFGKAVAFGERNNGILPEIGNYFLQRLTDFQYQYNLRITEFRFATDIWPVFIVKVISKILSLLSFTDLINCRLISKSWEPEARHLLELRGKVSLNLQGYEYTYFHPSVSLLIFHYLRENTLLHLKTLELNIPSVSGPITVNIKPSEIQRASAALKMFDDLKKLVSYKSFTALTLHFDVVVVSDFDFSILRLLLVELPLIELVFGGEVRLQLLREDPLTLSHCTLRKFTHLRCDNSENSDSYVRNWVNFFTPFLRGLTSLSLQDERLLKPYFLVETRFGNLRELYLKNIKFSKLSFLLKLRKLVVLEVLEPPNYYLHFTHFDDDISLLPKILRFHSESLERLNIQLSPVSEMEKTVLTFPKFPKLKEFLLGYNSNLKVEFKQGKRALVLDYSEFFPVLRTLKIHPRSFELKLFGPFEDLRWERVPFPLWKDGDPFQAFFPEGGCPVESVRELKLGDPEEDYRPLEELGVREEDEEELDRRLKNITEMFPNVRNKLWEEIRNGDFRRERKKDEGPKELYRLEMLQLIDSL